MIVKMKWEDLMDKINRNGRLFNLPQYLSTDGMYLLLNEIDNLLSSEIGTQSINDMLANNYAYICSSLLNKTSQEPPFTVKNIWKDLPIYCSSYSIEDLSYINMVYLQLLQYVGFYKKILTDKGLARKVVTHRDYRNAGHNESTNKNIYSETPQVHLADFDSIINYVSNATKNEDEGDSNTYGDSDLTVDSKSYEEAEKNMKYVYSMELANYIRSIPHIIYSIYALDSMPVDGIAEEVRNYFKALYERR